MKKALLCMLVVFCLTAPHAYSQIEWDAEKFMPLSEVKQGMSAKGYTVFSGITVEEFECKVVSIEYNFSPGWHVIWCEGLSDNFKRTGVAGGMSGSPVYIAGRLAGAVSLGSFNQREHSNLFGVTPIELMVKVAQRGMKPNLTYEGTQLFNLGTENATSFEDSDEFLSLFHEGRALQERESFGAGLLKSIVDSPGREHSTRLSIPVALPALNPEAMQIVKSLFDRFNFTPVQTAGSGSPVKESPVEAGQIVGTEFVRGDVTLFGYGTITYTAGNELLGYGHAGFGEGNVNLPLSGGYVHYILPMRTRSVKWASPTQPIGTLVQDRDPAIAGIIGRHPSYIPVNMNLQTTDGKQHQKYYEVIRHRSFSPIYTGMAAWFLIDGLEFYGNDHTLNLEAVVTLKDHPDLKTRELVYKNIYSSSSSPGAGVMMTLLSPLAQLGNNSYTNVQVENVNLDLKIGDRRRTARIQSLRIDKLRYRPGDTVEVEVTLQPYLESPITEIGTITIPKDTPEGLIMLLAGNANFHEAWQRARAPFNFRHKNINQLVELLKRGENNADIIMELFVPEPGLTVQGKEFESLPLSVMSVMNTAKQSGGSGYTTGTTLHIDRVPTDHVISGSGIIRLVVDRNAE